MSHSELRNNDIDSGSESPPQAFYDAGQPYDPMQYHESSYHPHHDNFTAHQYSTPQEYVTHQEYLVPQTYVVPQEYTPPQGSSLPKGYAGPWQTETEWTEATTAAEKPPSNASWFDRLNNGWTPEIVSEVCSVVFLLAMIILLSRLEGRPLSTWTIAVSPNAVIAILSIASKASLIYALGQTISQLKWLHLLNKPDSLEDLQHYDDASRGPLGAVRLFWSVRSASLIAYLGCITILLALAFEPFSQQLLHFDERVIAYPEQRSSVPFSIAYDFGAQGLDGASAVIVGPRDNPMRAAVVNGIYDVVKDPPFDCPGSTCSYPPVTSFGVCSECEDITSTITKTQKNTTFGQAWTLRTPGNLTLEASASIDAHSGFKHTLANATADTLNTEFSGLGMPVRTGIVRFPERSAGVTTISNWMDTMQAYECTISFCGHRYSNWNTTNGTLSPGDDQIIKLNNSDVAADGEPWYRDLPPLDPSESLDTGNGNNSFRIYYSDGENMASILTSVFVISGQIAASQQIDPSALYDSSDIPTTMDNVAKGMSYRMMSGPNSTTTHGEVRSGCRLLVLLDSRDCIDTPIAAVDMEIVLDAVIITRRIVPSYRCERETIR
ncbi:hypothetical protein E0Z10_g10616 [Xylaria hypoxylon]|uniref:Uncharacterized protein n=1 Tax=Xylaria hypoxylon TaxID=37992 RepID=A0A4Z0YKI3_9PEZI|nr:hypothetical protein E0Z10_g10616 [Xylaria hypoxylon]